MNTMAECTESSKINVNRQSNRTQGIFRIFALVESAEGFVSKAANDTVEPEEQNKSTENAL